MMVIISEENIPSKKLKAVIIKRKAKPLFSRIHCMKEPVSEILSGAVYIIILFNAFGLQHCL